MPRYIYTFNSDRSEEFEFWFQRCYAKETRLTYIPQFKKILHCNFKTKKEGLIMQTFAYNPADKPQSNFE